MASLSRREVPLRLLFALNKNGIVHYVELLIPESGESFRNVAFPPEIPLSENPVDDKNPGAFFAR
jgi:hypothetical protein